LKTWKIVFENKDKIVLVMQYASGGEVYDYVSYKKVLSDSEARRLFRQIATAIYYCHKVGIHSSIFF
jgi:NUAK family SNF1-like kinase